MMTRANRNRQILVRTLLTGILLLGFGGFVVASAQSDVNERPYNEGRAFGLGVVVGDPTGVSAEKWLGNTTALNFAAAWSLEHDDSVELSGDHLWYDFGAIDTDDHALALHYGLGARALFSDPHDDRVGVRFPVGLTYFAADGRVGLFGQVAPVLDLAPDTDLGVQGGIGARYFLR